MKSSLERRPRSMRRASPLSVMPAPWGSRFGWSTFFPLMCNRCGLLRASRSSITNNSAEDLIPRLRSPDQLAIALFNALARGRPKPVCSCVPFEFRVSSSSRISGWDYNSRPRRLRLCGRRFASCAAILAQVPCQQPQTSLFHARQLALPCGDCQQTKS